MSDVAFGIIVVDDILLILAIVVATLAGIVIGWFARDKAGRKSKHCEGAVNALHEIVAGLRALQAKPTSDRCRALNTQIDAYNDSFAAPCDLKVVPKLDCEHLGQKTP